MEHVFRQLFTALSLFSGAILLAGCAPAKRTETPPKTSVVEAAPHDYRDRNFDYFVTGDPRLPRAAHTQRGYALMGGGGSVDAAFGFLASNAGRGHIVILRAVSDDSYDPTDGDIGESFQKQWGGVDFGGDDRLPQPRGVIRPARDCSLCAAPTESSWPEATRPIMSITGREHRSARH